MENEQKDVRKEGRIVKKISGIFLILVGVIFCILGMIWILAGSAWGKQTVLNYIGYILTIIFGCFLIKIGRGLFK